MIWLLNNLYPVLHGMTLATSWGVLGWLFLRKLTQLYPMILRKERMKYINAVAGEGKTYTARLNVTTWYVLWFIPVFRSEKILSSNL